MIAVDTNVLIRYVTRDDEIQSEQAERYLERNLTAAEPGFISLVVVVEFLWVLERIYGVRHQQQLLVLTQLLETPNLVFESAELLATAIAMPHTDIADSLIHLIGRAHGCTHTATFDQRFARLDGVTALA
jgi:predicted nucleic-acid-binding protein